MLTRLSGLLHLKSAVPLVSQIKSFNAVSDNSSTCTKEKASPRLRLAFLTDAYFIRGTALDIQPCVCRISRKRRRPST